MLLHFFHLGALNFTEQVGSKNEVVQLLVFRCHYVVFRTLPFFAAIVKENDVFAYVHNGVHVVRIDNGRYVVVFRNAVYQVVNDERRFRVESRVWLVAEQVARVHRNGARYGHALLHTPAYLARHFVFGFEQVDTLETA